MNEKDFELLVESIKQAGASKRHLLARKQEELARQQLIESADIYAEIYSEDQDLQELTAAALADWPE
jgi:hypothetical protein